jgi:hypothetical protein
MRVLPVVLLCRSYQLLLKIRNSPILPAIPPRHEGRYGQSSRNVRWGAMDVWAASDGRSPCMRRNRVVPMPRRWHQVGGRAMSALRARHAGSADDGGYQARHSGESAYKPLDHRAGNAGMFRRTCGDLLACFLHLHARLRVRQTPGIPCALVSRRREVFGIPRTHGVAAGITHVLQAAFGDCGTAPPLFRETSRL